MLSVSQIFSYIIVLGIAAAVPGPGMTTVVARSVSNGFLFGFYALFGLIIGDLIYLSVAVFGYSIVVSHFSYLFKFIVWGASFYLIYLAWQFWFNPYKILGLAYNNKKKQILVTFCSGLAITLGNPKTIGFYLAILPLVIDIKTISLSSWCLILVPLTITVLFSVGTLFILASVGLRHLLLTAKAQRILYRSAAIIMLLAAVTMLIRS
jgi:threonine/homoserine/homoserine lactone efflux protein